MKTVQEITEENGSLANIERFQTMQKWEHKRKVAHAQEMAEAFYCWAKDHGKGVHLSVGGLDSITLHYFLESIGLPVTCVSCSSLEGKGVQKVHKQIAAEMESEYQNWMGDGEAPSFVFLKPLKSKVQVLQEFGWPVISKEKAGKIMLLQNPTEQNATVRHAIITGETGEYGGWQKNSRMKLPQKWLELFGGADAEGAALGYQAAPFKVSDRCCYYLKEKPCNDWAREHDSVPYMGLMASEGGRREKSLKMHGCNYFGKTTTRSAPFAIFDRQDILQLALDLDVPVPAEYGEIAKDRDGKLYTTKAQRTGCTMCGFGIHIEGRPHRFDILRETNPKEWEFWMKHVCRDENGNWYGWGRVLDYIGIGWEDVPEKAVQMHIDDRMGEKNAPDPLR
nr:MAG TPA: phosphoadenosine-phosphosulfate reductase [Caudoviricetes sp.]